MFIVIEGPNGVGKSTVVRALGEQIIASGRKALATAEPSSTLLGRAIRELEGTMPPRALALSCAADRYDHIVREIEPQLVTGGWVLCDRYVASSLVLQRIDGLDTEWIWELNKAVLQPDLTIYLEEDAEVIAQRLALRGRHSRLETKGWPALELDYFRDAREFLSRRGWKQTTVDCRLRATADIVAEIVAQFA